MRSLRPLVPLLLLLLIAGCARKSGAEGGADSLATSDTSKRRPAAAERMDPAIRVDAPEPAIPIEGDSIPFSGSVRRGEHGVRYRILQGRATLLEGTVAATEAVAGDTSGRLHFETRLPKPKGSAPTSPEGPTRPMPMMLMVMLDGGDTGRGAPRVMMPLMTGDGADTNAGTFNLYFRNPSMGDPKACEAVQPVRRVGPKKMQGRVVLAMLVRGPSPQEIQRGYRHEIPPGVTPRSYKEENGVAMIDFNGEMNRITDPCARTAIRAEIERTFKEMPGISSVQITVEGQPFQ